MLKVFNGENSQSINGIFRIRDETSYEFRQRSCFHIPSVNTVFSGTESIRFLGPKIWELITNDIKYLENLRDFKTAIKKIKEFSILFSSELDLGSSQNLRWSTFDKS